MSKTKSFKPSLVQPNDSHGEPQVWRSLPLLDAPGVVQMALDEWLLEQHQAGAIPPVLRFYSWSRPTLSLGYHQKSWPPHWENLVWQERDIDLVRRPSGGRAVLHQGDLTYALIVSGLSGKRAEIYQFLCQFLIEGWRSLGISLEFGQSGRGYIHNPNCFGTATAADLVTPDGSKLIGSAQLRRDRTILQHGSMRLNPDPELFSQVFQVPLSLSSEVQRSLLSISTEEAIAALSQAACERFNVSLVPYELTPHEWSTIYARASRYAVTRMP